MDNLSCYKSVLRNIEFEFDGKRTEIDAVVFTHKAIFIIEIKNSKKNIFIDEDGGFYRTGYSMHYDCNIADKMSEREAMLRKALDKVGLVHHLSVSCRVDFLVGIFKLEFYRAVCS